MSCRGRCGIPGGADAPGTPPPTSHRPVYIDMERSPTRMGEYMGENYAAEYSGYGGIRIPPSGRASTPGPYGYPSQYDTFGSQIDHSNISWIPKDINLSELLDQNGSSRLRRGEPPVPPAAKPPETTTTPSNPLLGPELDRDVHTSQTKKNEEKRRESLIQWFDRSVKKELKKHKESSFGAGIQYSGPVPNVDEAPELNLSRGTLERLSGATASQVEICFDLRQQPDTELTDAVDKFAKAEAMCEFAGAVKAAEAAAVAAPPELIEQAALASAKGFQTDLKTTGVQGELHGERPIEVVGYVGVTKPKYPTRRH